MDAKPHLIEWARRRRSYHYLGVNWAVAAILGLLIGLLFPWLNSLQRDYKLIILVLFVAFWVTATLWLAMKMRHDINTMEMAWVCARLDPSFKDSIASQEDDENESVE